MQKKSFFLNKKQISATIVAMKKSFFILMIALIFIVQWHWKADIQFFTLYDKGQRNILSSIPKNYVILPGEYDEYLGLRRKALFKIRVVDHRECFLLFLRDQKKQEDLIHLYDAQTHQLLSEYVLSPYQISQKDEIPYKAVLDLNQDGNLEIVVELLSKAGKRIQIFYIHHLSIVPINLNMAENYAQIYLEDLNHDGRLEIIAQTKLNGILQVPELFAYENQKLINLALTDYPRACKNYLEYLKHTQKKLSSRKEIYEIQYLDIKLSELLYYLDTSQTENFKLLANEVQNQLSSSTDPGKRLRYYRSSVYLSYLLLEQNNLSQAKDEIASAVRELQGLGRFRTEEELLSQVYLEIANYYRTKRSLQTAKEYLLEALKLNPNNMIARSTYESYFLEDAPS
jgi:hypothetical protein